MRLESLKQSAGAKHRRMRVGRGRGTGKGKTAGRGHKGQMARKGHKHKRAFEGGQMRLVRRIPKHGFTNPTARVFSPVNVSELCRFPEGTEVTVEVLRASGLVRGSSGGVKILGTGGIDRKLLVKAHAFSAVARAKIEASGGACEVVTD